MKRLFKFLAYSVLILLLLTGGLVASVYFFQDRIIKRFVDVANKSLNTPVTIGGIKVSALDEFPNLSIVFTNVYIEDSHPEKDTLLTASRISFTLNPIDVWNGIYDVKGLTIEDSFTRLYINAIGKVNYDILKPRETQSTGEAVSFNLKDVRLLKARVSYIDDETDLNHLFSGEDLTASIEVSGDMYKILASGDLTSHHVSVSGRRFLTAKTFDAEADVDYDDENKVVLINPSILRLGEATFDINGTYSFKERNLIDLIAEGKDTDIQTILALLPSDFSRQFQKHQSEGDVYFSAKVKGEISRERDPLLSVTFGCTNAALIHPDFNSRMTALNMEGSFATPSFSNLADAVLFLKNMHGELNGKRFDADFSIQNFEHPFVDLLFKGELDAQSILQFYPMPELDSVSGTIRANITFSGAIDNLRKKETAQKVKADGTLELIDVDFSVTHKRARISQLSGILQFNNNDLKLSHTAGTLGKTDFLLDGTFRNCITFMLFENQPIGIEADLYSKHVDLDQLLTILYGSDQSNDFTFSISPNISLNFNCNVGSVKYKRFSPANVKGNLLIKNQMAIARDIRLHDLGGAWEVNGILDSRNKKTIDIVGSLRMDGVLLDSLFYAFHDFDQDFVKSEHLEGQLFADLTTEMTVKDNLDLVPETLVADISAVIRKGELNNFAPMQSLNKYLDDEGLAHLRFADLKNEIHVENKTILIPQMEIRSNVTHITLRGTHHFDQRIDYRITAPLRNKRKIDPDEAFGAVQEDEAGRAQVFLKILGTTDEYDVSYDKQALKQKLAGEMKKEFQELRDAFKRKGKQRKKELELSDEEFDWN